MKTVLITDAYRPPVAYTDYIIMYRKVHGSTFRGLGLLAFCRKINNGTSVKVGGTIFTAASDYKQKKRHEM
jgi:hypothetical protein